MAEVLNVTKREAGGKRSNRRMRAGGQIPAILYGHGEDNVCLALCSEEFGTVVRHGSRMVKLAGDVNESAYIKEVQWDTWGDEVLHVDLTRVSEHEKVDTVVTLELRGESPGTKEGGVVKFLVHELDMTCDVSQIPEKIEVNINHLEFGQAITIADLELPAGTETKLDASTPVVQCVAPVEVAEAEAEAGEDEPEIIGRKKEEESEE